MTQVQRRGILEQAEGLLELATVLDDDLPLDFSTKVMLANRAIKCLDGIQNPLGFKPYLLFLKGQASRLAQRYHEAVNYLEQSRRIDGENLHLYFALAWCYKRSGRLAEAIEAMKTAVELDSESGIAHYNLSCYYALDEQIESALLHLSYAFELESRFRELAVFESDFDLIRGDSRFATMTSMVV